VEEKRGGWGLIATSVTKIPRFGEKGGTIRAKLAGMGRKDQNSLVNIWPVRTVALVN